MLHWIAALALRRARALLLLSLVAVIAMGAIGFGAFGKLQGGGFEDPDAPSSRAQRVIEEKFGGDTNLVLLVRAKDGMDSPATMKAGRELTEGVREAPHVSRVISWFATPDPTLASEDGSRVLVLAHVDGDTTTLAERAKTVTDAWTGDRGPVTVQAGGFAALNNDITTQVSEDLALAEAIAVPLTLMLLVVAFGSVVAALLPLAIGLIAILGTFAELYVLGSLTDVSVFSVNLTTALGLGLGIDYGLLLVSRFRERLAEGDEVPAALRTTVTTAGRTIAFSAATVIAALAALMLFPQFFLRSFAYAGVGVVAIAALAALIVVPALLAVLGPRVNPGRTRRAKSEPVRHADAPVWGRTGRNRAAATGAHRRVLPRQRRRRDQGRHRRTGSGGRADTLPAGTVPPGRGGAGAGKHRQPQRRARGRTRSGGALGHRRKPGRVPWPKSVRHADAPVWGRLAGTVMRRPALTALPVLAVLLLAASPLLGATFGTPDERVLPEQAASRQVSTALAEYFPGNDAGAIQIVTEGPVPAGELAPYAGELSRLDGVERVQASTGTYSDGRAAEPGPANAALGRPDAQRLTVASSLEPKSAAAQDLVREVRAVDGPGGVDTLVGGMDAQLVDSRQAIADQLPAAIGMVVGTTFVLLFLFTGSIVQPLRALLLNAVSLTAAIGAMVWVFQEGHLSGLLDFTPMPMDTSMTVLMFCIVFGLSMDYEVFVTSRIKELHDAGADDYTAVTRGLSRTGRIVTMAAGLLAVSFFAFVTGNVSFLQMFGLGSGLAILIDAVAVRGVLVPAAMRLLGRRAWYAPRWLRRVHRRIGLDEGGGPVAADTARPPAERTLAGV